MSLDRFERDSDMEGAPLGKLSKEAVEGLQEQKPAKHSHCAVTICV
jgi:hypothetical protein